MKTYIAILRGINVSGSKPIKMDALRAMCESLKFKNVRTYIQSGNIVFESKPTTNSALEILISKKIKEVFTFDVPVMVKDAEELKQVLHNNPFVKKRNEDISRLYVTFLSALPNTTLIDKLKEGNYGTDEYYFDELVVYLFCPISYGNSKLSNTFFENKLKLNATTRNWKTLTELLTMAEQK